MKPALRTKLEGLARRLEELNGLLSSENATRDMAEFKRLSREHAEVSKVAGLFADFQKAEKDAAEAREMASDPGLKGQGRGAAAVQGARVRRAVLGQRTRVLRSA